MEMQNESSSSMNPAQYADMNSLEENEVEAEIVASGNRVTIRKAFGSDLRDDQIFEIFTRLPVKSLLRLKCLSKTWCSTIHSRLFATTHLTRTLVRPLERSALLIVAYDKSTSRCHFLSGSYFGGSTTHTLTLPNIHYENTEVDHVNGLVLYRGENGFVKEKFFASLINPSTREVFRLHRDPARRRFVDGDVHICYFLGFDPSTDRFKILNTRITGLEIPTRRIVCRLFDLSSRSWKTIDPIFPFDLMGEDWLFWDKKSVCINGVIYIVFHQSHVLAAFDLRSEIFSLIPLPGGAIPSTDATTFRHDGTLDFMMCNDPYLLNYRGKLAVICPEKILSQNIIEMWILEDRDNQLWVKETIPYPGHLLEGGKPPLPRVVICTGEIMFQPRMISAESMRFHFYDMNRTSFRSMEIVISPEFVPSDDIEVGCHVDYVESIIHMRRNRWT